jgi:hypothetical protein
VVVGVGVMDGVRVGMPSALLTAGLFHCVSLADQAQPCIGKGDANTAWMLSM